MAAGDRVPALTDEASRAARIAAASTLLDSARAAQWRGPDPYDGLWRGWPAPLVGGRRRRQVILQLHARSPVDIRRLYRRRHPRLAKALGLFGGTAAHLFALTGDPGHAATAREALGLLDADTAAGPLAWGYPFDTQTRWSFYRADSPHVVVTTFAGLALLEAAEVLDEPGWRDRARGGAQWVLDALHLETGAFAYHEGSTAVIHNASLLGARLVHAAGVPGSEDAVRAAVARTLAAQRPDGAWPYGEGPGLGFVDGFHTGYVLDCLLALADVAPEALPAVERGAHHYREHFFGPAGEAWLWPDRARPEDAHAAGTALGSLTRLERAGLGGGELRDRVAARVLSHTIRDGHAVARRYGRLRTTVRYPRWCDAHVAHGLATAAG